MKTKVHVVPHTHWDREWFFSTIRSKVYLLKDLKDILHNLESNDGYDSFVLDGQASLVEDYLNYYPEDRDRIKKLVTQKKLIIGPWYTQTDQFVISGESIIRNLQIGMKICQNLGGYMNVGYVPDSFGQESSMPQIYKQLGISDTIFYRGVSDVEIEKSEFLWEGEDGTLINAYLLPKGYFIGGLIDENNLDSLMTTSPFSDVIERSSTKNIYFPNGFDQAPPRKNLPSVIKRLNALNEDFEFEISSVENYIGSVRKENPSLERLSGELVNGKDMRVHKTIYSSRSDIKKVNTEVQHYLVNTLEPILAIGEQLGVQSPLKMVDEIWKLMFENAAHDSIGSCVADSINEDILMRYKQVIELSNNLVEITLRQISMKIKDNSTHPLSLTVFNTLPEARSQLVSKEIYVLSENFSIIDSDGVSIDYVIRSIEDVTDEITSQIIQLNPGEEIYIPEAVYKVQVELMLENIPSFGYKRFYVTCNDKKSKNELTESTGNYIENEYYKIVVDECGSLTIIQKETGKTYEKQGIIVENGDDGDSFNYSPPREDLLIKSTDQKFSVNVMASELFSELEIRFDFNVPQNLTDRARGIISGKLPTTLKVRLEKYSDIIKCSIKVDNHFIDSHRMCIDFDSGIASKFSIADIQFGTLKRAVYRKKEMSLWEKAPNQWEEKPISIETCQSFICLSDSSSSVGIFPKGVREYEIVGDSYDTIRLTIFRTYGMMGKENLLYRLGRASGDKDIATPAAQLHDILEFEFGLYYGKVSFNEDNIAQKAKQYNTIMEIYENADFLNGRLRFCLDREGKELPIEFSFFDVEGDSAVSIVKKDDSNPGYLARFYNAKLSGTSKTILHFKESPSKVQLVDLQNNSIKDLPIVDGTVILPELAHSKLTTVYIE